MCLAIAATSFVQGLQKFTPIEEDFEAFFYDQFVYESLEKSPWKVSLSEKDTDYQYNGIVSIEAPKVFKAFRDDKALVLKSKAQLHAVTR